MSSKSSKSNKQYIFHNYIFSFLSNCYFLQRQFCISSVSSGKHRINQQHHRYDQLRNPQYFFTHFFLSPRVPRRNFSDKKRIDAHLPYPFGTLIAF